MKRNPNDPKLGGIAALLLANVVCCGGVVLVATGVLTLSGIWTWLLGGGPVWLVLGGLVLALFVLWWRQGSRGKPSKIGESKQIPGRMWR